MKNQPTSVTIFRKAPSQGVFFRTMSYLGLAVIMIFTAKILPPSMEHTDTAFATYLVLLERLVFWRKQAP